MTSQAIILFKTALHVAQEHNFKIKAISTNAHKEL